MPLDNYGIIEELTVLLRRADRVEEAFRLEREQVITERDPSGLHDLREHSRTIYSPKLRALGKEAQRLGSRIRADSPGFEEAQDTVSEITEMLRRVLSHVVSSPNRLIRASRSGALERLDELDSMESPP